MMLSMGTKAYADYATVQAPYEVDFTASQDQFVVEDVLNDLGTAIWTQSSSYGLTATTFVQLDGEEKKANHEGESWLISPIINLSGISTPTLAFTDQVNKYFGTIGEEIAVCIREQGGQWSSLNIPYEKPSSIWGGWTDRVVDLSAYAGKKIQVGFHYIGHATTAGTYEVKSFAITADAPAVKEEAGLSYDAGTYTYTIGETYSLPVLSNPNNLAVTFTSSNTNVATVDEQGTVTPLTAGQTTIKASSEETDKFKAGTASYLLVVKEKGQAGTDAYQLVTNASALSSGDQIIIVNEEMTYALSTTQNNNNRAATDVAPESDGSIVPSNLVQAIDLEGSPGQWYFNVGNAYLYAASTSSNHLKTQDNPDEKAMASITIEGGVATVLFNQWDEKARTLMRFNPNNGNPIFSCYAPDKTTGTALRIYKKAGGGVTKTLSINGTTPFDNSTTVTIIPSNEDYAVYYTTDGSTPNGSSKLYTAPFTISATTTVKAVEEDLGGKLSAVVEKTFVKNESSLATVSNIAEFKALEKNAEAELKLNNAVVLYAADRDVFVRDASGAIEFYNTGIEFTTGQVLNGSITGKYSPFNNLPELAKTNNTNAEQISFSEGGAPAPSVISIPQARANAYVCDLIRLSEVVITENEGNTFASKDGESLQLFDKFKVIEEGMVDGSTEYTVTGILAIYKENYQMYPTAIQTSSGIQEVSVTTFDPNAPTYNAAGQRVGANYKGIVIQGGRKYVK